MHTPEQIFAATCRYVDMRLAIAEQINIRQDPTRPSLLTIVVQYLDSTKCEIQLPICGGAYVGAYAIGRRYLPHEVVTKDRSMWMAVRETSDTPDGSSSDWAPFEASSAEELRPLQERWLADLNQLIRTLVGANA